MAAEPLVELDYAAAVDAVTLAEVGLMADVSAVRLLIAARVGPVRLIDNSAALEDADDAAAPSHRAPSHHAPSDLAPSAYGAAFVARQLERTP